MAFITDMTEHKKALALAGEVQKSLLPQSKPIVHGLDIAGRNVSCDEIGGDYFDFLWRRENPDGPFSVVVGDITGHGVDSALLMTSARAFLRMRASQPGTMSEIVTAMNRHLTRDVLETGRFMTLFYLTVDPRKDRIDWVRAGHDPAILYDPQKDTFIELKGSGMALGVNDAFKYAENRHEGLANGQIIAIGAFVLGWLDRASGVLEVRGDAPREIVDIMKGVIILAAVVAYAIVERRRRAEEAADAAAATAAAKEARERSGVGEGGGS
jgi:sigma-B regulation protein RsbU (phosphoserine phosphatase)